MIYKSNNEGILYIGNWESCGEFKKSTSDFSKALIMFEGNGIRISAKGNITYSVDSGTETANCNIDIPVGIHTLFITAEKDCKIYSIETDRIIHPDTFLREQMQAEYNEIQKGRTVFLDKNRETVKYSALTPDKGVILSGFAGEIFRKNIDKIKRCFKKPEYLEELTDGWSKWLPAANDGRMLGGAAKSLAWYEDSELRLIIDTIIDKTEKNMREDGYYNYYPEEVSYAVNHIPNIENSMDVILNSERKNYDRVFWTYGIAAAHSAGSKKALPLARRMYDWLESSQWASTLLLGHNATNAFMGNLILADSEAGTDEDILFSLRYLDQKHIREELVRKNPAVFSNYPGDRPHCYDLLELLAIAYEYRLTGDKSYLDALLGGWEIYTKYYKHIGGTTAICEHDGPYPPGSYHMEKGHTGETCGSVFWIWVNEELHKLFPDEAKYAAEIEECLFNVVPSIYSSENKTRYHNRLQGEKDAGGKTGTCCELTSTLLFADLPKYIYSYNNSCIWINQYISSEITGSGINFTIDADFYKSNEVKIQITKSTAAEKLIKFRIPDWSKKTKLYINGILTSDIEHEQYIGVKRIWSENDTIILSFSLSLRTVCYTGSEQPEGSLKRYALFYGPYLMALTGNLSEKIPQLKISHTSPELNKTDNLSFIIPHDGNLKFVPYIDIGDSTPFCCMPVYTD